MTRLAPVLCALSLLAGSATAQLQPIEVKGSKFFYKNGTQFFMKGVAYQQDAAGSNDASSNSTGYTDPLSDEKRCARDIPLLQELGTNTIRTYAVDPTADHSACMNLLEKAGIYVVSDLGEPSLSINRDTPQWNTELFTRYKNVVDELSKYPNVIGFFAGNEVSNAKNNTGASAYVKAAVRDTKAYIKNNKKIGRWMGVGYAANDDENIRDEIAHYFNCGDQADAIDFWGYNIYSWCGDSNLKDSGYDKQAEFFSNFSVPVFFAEYGCNQDVGGAAGRKFTETSALYSNQMTPVFSGGIVYMYFEEANDFGLVKVTNEKATKLKDFDALKSQVAKATPSATTSDDYKPTASPAQCPDLTDKWQASKDLPPTPDQSLCDCMVSASSCVPQSGLSPKKFGDIFGFVCGKNPSLCAGVNGNATTGKYGTFSMCDDKSKLAFVLDAYYNSNSKSADSCSFDGSATTQKASTATSCSAALASASKANDVASQTSGSSTKDNAGLRGIEFTSLISMGSVAISLHLFAAAFAGAAIITL